MKRFVSILSAVVVIAGLLGAPALADKIYHPAQLTNTGANGSWSIGTQNTREVQITVVTASGTPDGTVTVYVAADDSSDACVVGSAVPTTTPTTIFGSSGGVLTVTLTGNTTGTVRVTALVK